MDAAHLSIAISIAVLVCEAAADQRSGDFTRRPCLNDTVTYRVIRATQARSLARCSAACVTQRFCRHFRFCEDTGNCVVSDDTVNSTSYNHVEDTGCLDFDREVCTHSFFTSGYVKYKYPFHSFEGEFVAAFSVRTCCDAILNLSTSADSVDGVQYQIVIGGNGNKVTVIRRCTYCDIRATVKTPSILSANEMRRFWFRYSNGHFSLGKYQERAFFEYYETPRVTTAMYFGISSWSKTADWLFYVNCS